MPITPSNLSFSSLPILVNPVYSDGIPLKHIASDYLPLLLELFALNKPV